VDRFIGKDFVLDSNNGLVLDHNEDMEKKLKKYYKELKGELRSVAKRVKLKKSYLDNFIGLNKFPKAKDEKVQVTKGGIRSPKSEKGNYDHRSRTIGHSLRKLNRKQQADLKKKNFGGVGAMSSRGGSRKSANSRKVSRHGSLMGGSFVNDLGNFGENESVYSFAKDDRFLTEKEATEIGSSEGGGQYQDGVLGESMIHEIEKSKAGNGRLVNFENAIDKDSFTSFGVN